MNHNITNFAFIQGKIVFKYVEHKEIDSIMSFVVLYGSGRSLQSYFGMICSLINGIFCTASWVM